MVMRFNMLTSHIPSSARRVNCESIIPARSRVAVNFFIIGDYLVSIGRQFNVDMASSNAAYKVVKSGPLYRFVTDFPFYSVMAAGRSVTRGLS